MKRIWPIVLALMLFAGCSDRETAQPTQTEAATTQPTHASTYVENSEVEAQSGGAVRLYAPADGKNTQICQLGDRILLINAGEQTILTALSGSEGTVAASLTLPMQVSVWQSTYSGFAYYDADNSQAVYLDPQLQETNRFQLPGDIVGSPAFAPDGSEIYYCVGGSILALDTELGVSRPVRTHSCQSQTLTGCYLDGTVLCCTMEHEDGSGSTLYLSSETGEILRQDGNVSAIYSYESTYFAVRRDATVLQYIFSSGTAAAQQLNVAENYAAGAVELGGAVGYSVADSGLQLSFYELASGKRIGAVSLAGVSEPKMFLTDRWTGCIWILTQEGQLLRWDPKQSAVEDERVYLSPVYSAAAPDEAGLEALQQRVDKMNSTYGVTLRIWQAAVKSNNGYDLEPEYQTAAIGRTLDAVESILGEFPEKFLYKSVNRTVRICIVRSVNGQTDSAYYWFDKDPFIVLSVGVDVRQEFLKAFAYVLDIHVLGNSPLVDQWEQMNPEGFTYGAEQQDPALLAGETRAFADESAMTSVTEDRISIFYQAMQPDNADMFQSETMQKKLLQLCKAIRDAWRLERKTDTYLWEQYLTEPIAYKDE